MEEKNQSVPAAHLQYYGLDLLKFIMALLVATRHATQLLCSPSGWWHVVIEKYLSNLAVPVFFMISAFFFFKNGAQIKKYLLHLLKMTIIWNLVYLPLDLRTYANAGFPGFGAAARQFLKYLLFSSNTVHLWFLPALMLAVAIVYFLYKKKVPTNAIVLIGALLFIAGTVIDNWFYNQYLPGFLQTFSGWYSSVFITARNGLFYGVFFVALGLWFYENEGLPDVKTCLLIFVPSMILFYFEAKICRVVNMAFCSAPAAFALTALAMKWKGTERKPLFIFLRKSSEWIYYLHIWIISIGIFIAYGW